MWSQLCNHLRLSSTDKLPNEFMEEQEKENNQNK